MQAKRGGVMGKGGSGAGGPSESTAERLARLAKDIWCKVREAMANFSGPGG